MSNNRSHGVNAAAAYLLRKQPRFDAIACLKEWGMRPARFPFLFGMNLAPSPHKAVVKNALGNPLSSLSL